MDIHDFEQWCARRDPRWYESAKDRLYALWLTYKDEESLAMDLKFPEFMLNNAIHQAKKASQQSQLSLF